MICQDKLIHQAVVLAAGEGTRLKPMTNNTPKVMLPINGTPLICYTLNWFRQYGFDDVILNVHHLGNRIMDYLGDGKKWGIHIDYSIEERLLGTAGGVKRMAPLLDDSFVVIYGDVLTDCDLSALLRFHQDKQAVATLALFEASNPAEVGVVEIDESGRVLSFVEKPTKTYTQKPLANGGICVLNKSIFELVPVDVPCDFGYEVLPQLIEQDMRVYGYQLPSSTYLIDIGTTKNYQQANLDVVSGKIRQVPSHAQNW